MLYFHKSDVKNRGFAEDPNSLCDFLRVSFKKMIEQSSFITPIVILTTQPIIHCKVCKVRSLDSQVNYFFFNSVNIYLHMSHRTLVVHALQNCHFRLNFYPFSVLCPLSSFFYFSFHLFHYQFFMATLKPQRSKNATDQKEEDENVNLTPKKNILDEQKSPQVSRSTNTFISHVR